MALKYYIFKGGSKVGPPTRISKGTVDPKFRFGRTRTEQDANLTREGWGTIFSSDEEREQCKFLEKEILGTHINDGVFLQPQDIRSLMRLYKDEK